jgi:glycine betaine/proline transport system permease protein
MIDRIDIPQLPLKQAISSSISFLNQHLSWLFGAFSTVIQTFDVIIRSALHWIPSLLLIALISGFLAARRRYATAILTGLSLLLVLNIGMMPATLDTIALLIIATLPALILGLPIGILIAEFRSARSVLVPILDLMQTVPAFVYLIPSVLFFGVGVVPGVIATAIFALPPFARAVALGLGEVAHQFVEVGHSVGLTEGKLLAKVKLPLAMPYILTGMSQAVMMSLSMVVIASLIGAPGVGTRVIESLSQMDFGVGIEAGITIVVLAITIERILEAAIAGKWIWKR